MVFMVKAINKAKFVQATHYGVRLQSPRFIVSIPPSFLGIFAPSCQPTNVFFLSRTKLPLAPFCNSEDGKHVHLF